MAEDEDGSPFNVLETETELLRTAWTALEGSTAVKLAYKLLVNTKYGWQAYDTITESDLHTTKISPMPYDWCLIM